MAASQFLSHAFGQCILSLGRPRLGSTTKSCLLPRVCCSLALHPCNGGHPSTSCNYHAASYLVFRETQLSAAAQKQSLGGGHLLGTNPSQNSNKLGSMAKRAGHRRPGAGGVYKRLGRPSYCSLRASGTSVPDHVERISSANNPFIKHCVKLRQSGSYRRENNALLVVGEVPLKEMCELAHDPSKNDPYFQTLLVADDAEVSAALLQAAGRVIRVSPGVLGKLAGVENASSLKAAGVVPVPLGFADFSRVAGGGGDEGAELERWCPGATHVLALEGVQDPGNLGTLLRTAAAFAWDGVFLLPGCCDPFNEKALRASRGASLRLPIGTGQWKHLETFASAREMALFSGDPEPPQGTKREDGQKRVQNIQLSDSSDANLATAGAGRTVTSSVPDSTVNLGKAASAKALCLVLGSEGQGLSEEATRVCQPVAVPMPGAMESLNVAVAGGILLYLLKSPSI